MRSRRLAVVGILGCVMSSPLAAAEGTASEAVTARDVEAAIESSAGLQRPDADDSDARLELLALAAAWDEGGGSTGFPFWEKAYRRWQDGRISPAEFRQYTLEYRALLRIGREAVADVDVDEPSVEPVAEQAVDAVEARIDGLADLATYLEAQSATPAPAADDEERIRQAERLSSFRRDLQLSYLLTRSAMNDAQALLRSQDQETLLEDSFL